MALATDPAAHALAVVLAGGAGTRLAPLTRDICKPALPFGGVRSIDFSLANCLNSGIRNVGVPTQYKPAALLAHLDQAWSEGAIRGISVVPWRADERAPRLGYRGTADAVYRNLELIDTYGPSLVLVLAGDHVYKMDYRPLLEAHCMRGADVTVGAVTVPTEAARHFGVMAVEDTGRIRRFVEKPRSPADLPDAGRGGTVLASMGIYVFDTAYLARILTVDAFTPGSRHDFGGDILPRLIADARAFAYRLGAESSSPAYWRDIGTLAAYWGAHMEMLGPAPRFSLDDTRWPIRSATALPRTITTPTFTERGGVLESSLVVAPAAVAGRVHRAVLFDGVAIGSGSSVVDSIVLPGATIGPRCSLRGVIVDAGYHVAEGTTVEHDASNGGPLVLSQGALQQFAPYAAAG